MAWASLLFAGVVANSTAQVVLDGKFGTSGAVAGPTYAITPEMGSVRGNNLFHSFQKFDLNTGDVASFSGPGNIQNILTRVTGGSPSSINGTIKSEIPGANFFLINPSGVMFGPTAAIDVSGTFAVSSANYLKLADGARFVAALDADDSLLSTAPVSAFGFLNANPGSIVAQGSQIQSTPGQTISIVGGDLQFEGSAVMAPMGQVNLVSVKSAGEAPVDPASLNRAQFQAAFPQQGAITMTGARVDANGDGGGRVVIRGGSLVADNSRIEANSFGATDGIGIDVALTGELKLLNIGQINSLSPAGLGRSGNIAIDVDSIRMDGAGQYDENFNPAAEISTATGDLFFGGDAAHGGDISIHARSIELVNGAQITAATYGFGDAGRIDIDAGSIRLDAQLVSPTQISANAQQLFGVGGKAGEVHIRADDLKVENGAVILSATYGSSPAGTVSIDAGSVEILNSGIINAATFGSGPGGNIDLKANSLTIDGRNTLNGGPAQVTGIQAVTSSAFDPAPGGNIAINARSIDLKNHGAIFTASFGAGQAGDVTINSSGNIVLNNLSSINTSAPNSSGGDISVTAGSKLLLSNSEINAQAGLDGGNITVTAPDLIYVQQDSRLTARADTTKTGFGNGGNLTISPGAFLIINDASLISSSSRGNGGNISILSDNFFKTSSLIDASAPFGLPGTVKVTAPDVDLSGVLIGLSENVLDASSQLRPDCAVRLSDNISSFIVLGRGGLPLQPGGFLPSGMVLNGNEAK